jgi:hypothetical protein
MDQVPLVDGQIEEGRKLIDALREDGFPVTAAAWLQESDAGEWYLYLGTPKVDTDGLKAAYMEFQKTYRRLVPQWIGPFAVRLIGTDAPVARAARTRRRFPGPVDAWHPVSEFGGVPVDRAFVYGDPSLR